MVSKISRLTGRRPEHEVIYERLRDKILFGDFHPGQPLTIHGLKEELGAGVTPIREAIRKLTSQGALMSLENRRVAIPIMDLNRLSQIYLVRLTVEPELAEKAAKSIGIEDIEALEQLDKNVNSAIQTGDINGYLKANYEFHFSLYKHANSPILDKIVDSMWLQMGPSLRVGCGLYGTSNLKDLHFEATSALRSKDVAKVRAAIFEDIQQGQAFVEKSLES